MEKVKIETKSDIYKCKCEIEGKEKELTEYQKFMAECMSQRLVGVAIRTPEERRTIFTNVARDCAMKWRTKKA